MAIVDKQEAGTGTAIIDSDVRRFKNSDPTMMPEQLIRSHDVRPWALETVEANAF
jgi:hypothetical protein